MNSNSFFANSTSNSSSPFNSSPQVSLFSAKENPKPQESLLEKNQRSLNIAKNQQGSREIQQIADN